MKDVTEQYRDNFEKFAQYAVFNELVAIQAIAEVIRKNVSELEGIMLAASKKEPGRLIRILKSPGSNGNDEEFMKKILDSFALKVSEKLVSHVD